MGELLLIAFLVAMAFVILMFKIGIRFFVRFNWQTDVLISGIIAALFVGTMSGMIIGLIAGIIVSVILSILRWIIHVNNEPSN